MCTKVFGLAVGEKTRGGEAPLNDRNDFGESRSWNGDGKVEWTSQSLGPTRAYSSCDMREVGCTRRASDARDQVTCKH